MLNFVDAICNGLTWGITMVREQTVMVEPRLV